MTDLRTLLLLRQSFCLLTFPLPSLLVPTPFTQGGGFRADPPAISETVVPMNVKFCGILETPLKVLEMLKLFTWCLLGYHSNFSKKKCFGGKSLDFSQKYQ